MPSQILHTLFGEDVIAEIYSRIRTRFGIVAEKALEKITREYRTAFALGCQGPDIFYHNQRTRPVALEYGTLLHRRGCGMFTAVLLKMGLPDPPPDEEDIRLHRREKGINALGAYALGFMTHAVLDRFCHPYIVYKSVTLPPPKGRGERVAAPVLAAGPESSSLPPGSLGRHAHPFFERIIDALMLALLRGRAVSSWDQEAVLADICDRPPLGLKELLARSLQASFPERAGNDPKLALRMDNTFADAAHFYRATAPANTSLRFCGGPSGPPHAGERWDRRDLIYVYPEAIPLDIDYLNLRRSPWFYPAGEEREDRRSFPEIYAQALKAAADSLSVFIIRYLEEGFFPIKEAAQSIGNSGLSVQDENGKPCAVTRTGPLPLDKVLEWRILFHHDAVPPNGGA
ncbi:hypothetical protein AGMMS49546_09890 [Spirochaetia bacterium]|nr:hypothetical protein AGMMS49546_09890 [Spirochaetia bacterium]